MINSGCAALGQGRVGGLSRSSCRWLPDGSWATQDAGGQANASEYRGLLRTSSRAGYAGRVKASWRWLVCAALLALLLAMPFVVRIAPVPGAAEPSAGTLLERMRSSWSLSYAGYAETTGALALPTADQLDSVSNLLSSRTQMRVWWRSADDWRADTLSPSGESSTRTSGPVVSVWNFEDNRVVRTPSAAPGTVRMPQDSDTLPPQLAARMLGDATPKEVAPLPPRRVAGRAADGLRLKPADPLTSVGRVDVWADRASGVPLLVEVYGRTGSTAAMSSTFLDFSDAMPTPEDTRLTPPPGARVRTRQRFDLVREIGRTAGPRPPARLLGFSRAAPAAPGLDGIGQYGRGVTQMVVGALPDEDARSLREQLALAAGATTIPQGIVVSVGPVSVLLTSGQGGSPSWLVSGTVTLDGLVGAAAELPTAGAS